MEEMLKVFSPYDGHLIRELKQDDEETCMMMLENAHRLVQNITFAPPLHERIAILERTADLVDQRKEDFARQSSKEGGKTPYRFTSGVKPRRSRNSGSCAFG